MGRPRSAKPSSPAEIDAEDGEAPEGEPDVDESEDGQPEPEGKGISKAGAVRDALARGKESPEDGTDYIRRTHGIAMSRPTFSSYKAQQKARDSKKQAGFGSGRRGAPRGPRKQAAAAPELGIAPGLLEGGGEMDLLEAIEAMKPLVASLGADKVKRIVDLLG